MYCYNNSAFAQYGVQSNLPSNSELPMFTLFQEGNCSTLTDTQVTLESGYLYLVDFIFLATTEKNGTIQITPKINGNPNLLYSVFASAGTAARDASVSGSFTLPVSDTNETLAFYLTYSETVRNIDISGAVSITPLSKIRKKVC